MRLARVYRQHYAPLHSDLRAFPGMLELLERLARRGAAARDRQCEAERHRRARLRGARVRSRDGRRGGLRRCRAAREAAPRPDPRRARPAGADPDDTAYVGDAPFDIAAAKAAGVHAIGVTWGGIHTRERMEAEGPDAVVDTVDELYAVL